MRSTPAFAADAMLGTLARWLRLLGYDCFYEADIADDRLAALAKSQDRQLLTRDRTLAQRVSGALFVESDDLDEQLLSVVRAFSLPVPEEPPTTRCSLCNALLVKAAEADLEAADVPSRVRAGHTEFWRCPSCGRVYWQGTHVDSMGERLARLRGKVDGASAEPRAGR